MGWPQCGCVQFVAGCCKFWCGLCKFLYGACENPPSLVGHGGFCIVPGAVCPGWSRHTFSVSPIVTKLPQTVLLDVTVPNLQTPRQAEEALAFKFVVDETLGHFLDRVTSEVCSLSESSCKRSCRLPIPPYQYSLPSLPACHNRTNSRQSRTAQVSTCPRNLSAHP